MQWAVGVLQLHIFDFLHILQKTLFKGAFPYTYRTFYQRAFPYAHRYFYQNHNKISQ